MNEQWKQHPKFRDLNIKADGSEIKYNDKLLKIKGHTGKTGRILKVVYFNNSYYSVPKLILETYGEPMPEGRHYATYKDGNIENLSPNNLFWSKKHLISPERKFESDIKRSKLTKDQTYSAMVSQRKGIPISKIAENYKVSDMTVFRAVQRLKRKIKNHQ